MLAYIWCSPVFLLAILVLSTEDDLNTSEAIISDVVKNISLVNNVLQELIKNYEYLQKIYKSQEILGTTDHTFGQKKKKKRSREKKKHKVGKLAATKMSWSEIEDNTDETTANIKKKALNSQTILENGKQYHIELTTNKITKKNDLLLLLSSNEEKESKNPHSSRVKQSSTQVPFGDIQKNRSEKYKRNRNTTPEMIGQQQITMKKTKINIHPSNRNSEGHNTISEDVNYTTTVRRHKRRKKQNTHGATKTTVVMHINITTNASSNKEIKTQTHHNTSHVASRNSKNEQKGILDKYANATKLVRARNEYKMTAAKQSESESTEELTEEDAALSKDMFKTSILRKAYGDACMKLVVRKCYRACKNTINLICRSPKCQREFRSVFSKSYKEKCESVFADMMYRTAVSSIEENAEGFLTAVCQPQYKSLPILLESETNTNKEVPGSNLDLLRSKYENACIKSSRQRCNDACKYAYTKACEEHECKKGRITKFERICKSQCTVAYVSENGKHKSSVESGSSSSSESGSSSDSD